MLYIQYSLHTIFTIIVLICGYVMTEYNIHTSYMINLINFSAWILITKIVWGTRLQTE